MNIALVTIPGTGTRFFDNLLKSHYPKTSFEDDGLTTGHVNEDLLTRLKKIRPFIVTTWRPYEKIEDTLIRREFEPMERLPMHWKAWKHLMIRFGPFVVTIEPSYQGVSRETLLKHLGRKLGIELETDWAPVR